MVAKKKKKAATKEEPILVSPDGTEPQPAGEPVINEDFSFEASNGRTYKLTIKEKLFCEKYLEFYGTGVQAVFAAGYKTKDPKVAAAIAYENLKKPHLMAYIDSKLVEYGFNDDNVEKHHLYVMSQYADLPAKNKAIEMFYKLKGKFAPDKHVVKVENLTDLIADKLGRSRPVSEEDTERS